MQATLAITAYDLKKRYAIPIGVAFAMHNELRSVRTKINDGDHEGHWSHALGAALEAIDAILYAHAPGTTHGVDGIVADNGEASICYLSTGDCYGTTIMAIEEYGKVTITLGSFGDWVETMEARGHTFA